MLENGLYRLIGHVAVSFEMMLTMKSGVTVNFDSGEALEVEGAPVHEYFTFPVLAPFTPHELRLGGRGIT